MIMRFVINDTTIISFISHLFLGEALAFPGFNQFANQSNLKIYLIALLLADE